MNVRFSLQVLLVCALVALALGRRGGARGGRGRGGNGQGGRGGRGWRPMDGDHVHWRRNLTNTIAVNESAILSAENNFVIYKSVDGNVTRMNMNAARTYYGFGGDEPIMVISVAGQRGRGKPCFIGTPDLAYDQMVQAILTRNGSTLGVASSVNTQQLNGMGPALSREDSRALVRANPFLRRMCGGPMGGFRDTRASAQGATETAADAAASPETPVTVKVLLFNGEADITMPASLERNRPTGRRGGRGRGGRRGGAGRRGGRGGRGGRRGGRGRGGRGGRGGRRNRGPQ